MDFINQVVVPAALSEILGRVFSFLADKFPLPAAAAAGGGGARDVHHRRQLERLLGSIGSVVEEAEGRHITNHQLLCSLKALTEAMYRGRFALEAADLDDAIKNNADGDDRRSSSSAPLHRAKRSRVASFVFRAGDDGGAGLTSASARRLADANQELESLTRDCMRGFILLVQGYPRNVHRAVATTLYMDRRVFGRHVEKERVPVLAVVGAKKVGKTTLVKHACADERVRGHFARVEWFETPDVVKEGGLPGQTVWESDGPEYLAGVRRIISRPRPGMTKPLLLVFEDAWPMDESAWRELAGASTGAGEGRMKLLFTCRDADAARVLGTVEPVVLSKPTPEEYWYYFKAFAFRGTDPREHPRAAAVGREICEHMDRTYLEARVLGGVLGANLDARFWRRVLAATVRCDRRPLHVGVLVKLLPINGRLLQSYGYCRSPPELTVRDVLGGSVAGSLDGFTVHLCRETLYMDHWYSITFNSV
ncbi:hypothetical protein BRADI_4g24930v3 [Brachypodium distachyon]|uniref:NB-ARC domain-containing protein n=1 Tax=Brachypodium distachyon TaxID=15368 RepID=A0A2K2CQ44_BRADI|nr:hypothetical protein BRADI_4g24930v3 [Brachypodium distachyon]